MVHERKDLGFFFFLVEGKIPVRKSKYANLCEPDQKQAKPYCQTRLTRPCLGVGPTASSDVIIGPHILFSTQSQIKN